MKPSNQSSVQILADTEPSKSTQGDYPPNFDHIMIQNPSLSSIQFDGFKSRVNLNPDFIKKKKIGLVSFYLSFIF